MVNYQKIPQIRSIIDFMGMYDFKVERVISVQIFTLKKA